MFSLRSIEPVDYLVIGHLSKDLTPDGPKLGGTAAYAGLTAKALGLRVGIVSAFGPDLPLEELDGIQVAGLPSEVSTTFENIYTPDGRIQKIHHIAPSLGVQLVPDTWRSAPIVHLGPIAQEIEPGLSRAFPSAFLGMTLQGWMREWDEEGRVYSCEWPEARYMMENASAAVFSIEDVQGNEDRVDELASSTRVLAVTEAAAGARIFWNGDLRRFRPPEVKEVDPVGAGDIFAAAFFIRLHTTRDPWEAARFATQLASASVTRPGLRGVPTADEVQTSLIEVI